MKNKKLLTTAAMLAGAFLFTAPLPVSAYSAASYSYEVSAAVPAPSGLQIIYENNRIVLTWANSLKNNLDMCVEWSVKNTFPNTKETNYSCFSGSQAYLDDELTPGTVYYIRARVRNYSNRTCSAWSQTLTCTAAVPDVSISERNISSNSVSFNFDKPSSVTGYEIYRSGSSGSYKKIAKISDNLYTDSGLETSQVYRYKIRAFTYDKITKKTSYGDWTFLRVNTWGKDLDLKASPVSTKSVKLKWNKIPGASGYEIYRSEGSSLSSAIKNGKTSSFTNYRLIKTVKKKTSYTDKKLTPGESYTYKVVAFKNKASKKKKASRSLTIEDTDSATLKFGAFFLETVSQKDGSTAATWKKVIGATGYLIEVYSSKDNRWNKVTLLPSSQTSYIFPKSADEETTQYRICPCSGNNYGNRRFVYTTNYPVGKTSGIQAYATADGLGVNVSWAAVPGAAYYIVYRSTVFSTYNADLDSYSRRGTAVYIPQDSNGNSTCKIRTTSVTDKRYEYRYGNSVDDYELINEGPEQGIKYYYYVQAYKSNGVKLDSDGDSYESYTGAALYSKPAGIILNTALLKPAVPSVKSKKKGQAVVSWKKTAGAEKYYVYRSSRKGNGYTLAGITSKTSFTNKKLKSGATFYYKIKAYKANAVGADQFSAISGYKKVKIK